MGRTTNTQPEEPPTSALFAAVRWLRHPTSLAALALLVLNDHVLKAQFGTWWTGKLSDIAGLVFAPALVAVALAAVAPHARARAVAATSLATTGVAFIAVKASAVGAGAASALLSHAVGPSLVRADTTDLVTLPALAIGWLTFRASRRKLGAPARTLTSRLGAVLLVGAATAATLATSYIGVNNPLAVAVIPDGDGLLVRYQEPYRFPHIAADRTSDGVTWETFCESLSTNECEDPVSPGARPVTSACVPSDPGVCFRVQAGRIGVDRSYDGGKSWHPAWGLTDAERDLLVAFHEVDDPDTQLVSLSLGVIDVPNGYVVVVANGFDGLAVRRSDGSWERRGFLDSDCCSSTTPPVDVSTPFATVPGFPPGLAMAAAAWGFAFAIALLATRTREGHGRRGGVGYVLASIFRWIAGALFIAAGLLICSASAIAAARSYPASPDRLNNIDLFMVILVVCVTGLGVATVTLGSIVAPLWRGRPLRWAMLGAAAAATVATVAALAADAAWSDWEPVAAVTGAALLVALVPAVAMARRRRAGERRPGPTGFAAPT